MPSYSYKCSNCGHTFDEIHSVDSRKDPESKPCPNCDESNHVKQIITGFVGVTYGDKLQTPTWFKDRLTYMNKELGTNVSPIK
jgi:putative FmdB family regulatory protein